MANPSPLQRGRTYHIYNRGVNRENIFAEERNYRYFLQLYAKHIGPIADTFGYSLLGNHFHFAVRINPLQDPAKDLAGVEPTLRRPPLGSGGRRVLKHLCFELKTGGVKEEQFDRGTRAVLIAEALALGDHAHVPSLEHRLLLIQPKVERAREDIVGFGRAGRPRKGVRHARRNLDVGQG